MIEKIEPLRITKNPAKQFDDTFIKKSIKAFEVIFNIGKEMASELVVPPQPIFRDDEDQNIAVNNVISWDLQSLDFWTSLIKTQNVLNPSLFLFNILCPKIHLCVYSMFWHYDHFSLLLSLSTIFSFVCLIMR